MTNEERINNLEMQNEDLNHRIDLLLDCIAAQQVNIDKLIDRQASMYKTFDNTNGSLSGIMITLEKMSESLINANKEIQDLFKMIN
jgi:uncharacterized coiled-coil protein SlyX